MTDRFTMLAAALALAVSMGAFHWAALVNASNEYDRAALSRAVENSQDTRERVIRVETAVTLIAKKLDVDVPETEVP